MSAIVRKSSSLGFVSRADFEDLIREDPTVYPYVLEILAADVRAARLGIHLTQVGPTCSVRGHGRRLSADASGA
jgi:hypothetical protein